MCNVIERRVPAIAHLTAILAIAATVSGCVSAQVDFEQVEVTKQNLAFAGISELVPIDLPEQVPEALMEQYGIPRPGEDFALPPQRFAYADAMNRLPEGFTASLQLRDIAVTPARRKQKLAFLHKVLLTVSDPEVGEGRPRVVFETDQREAKKSKNGAIQMPLDAAAASIDPSRIGEQTYELSVWGDLAELPRESWAVDVTLTLSGSVAVEY